MKNVLFFDYFATGEGQTIEIFYTNNSFCSDEDAIEKWKAEHDKYFHVGLEILPLDSIEDNKYVMQIIKIHTPSLYEFIQNENSYAFKCDYKVYFNYS